MCNFSDCRQWDWKKACKPKVAPVLGAKGQNDGPSQTEARAEEDAWSRLPPPRKKQKKHNSQTTLRASRSSTIKCATTSTRSASNCAAASTPATAVPHAKTYSTTPLAQLPAKRPPLVPIPLLNNSDYQLLYSELSESLKGDLFGSYGEPALAVPGLSLAFASSGPVLPTFPSPPPLAPRVELGRARPAGS